ncbi:AGC family protein kinase [Trichomonas vaginalis G3]|uniref:AGC family protein kinase n=1 Tax=Trichomonas vaginalis (strain ATCC PRA-98 / G3) TaxID=412133 RepID=A2FIE4_TRIV3|nr:protein kinase protein [Trichomonas vaginalis G3]EAX95306.1 AGC family protein kinase [Trichomonas vaginalis G3]KAI5500573.1 protein kinase protein [Trichomonas vaginalis G3]|eukprot:XP_001308236.1 AGC family protein kinase [Trichomonas vaginalis G3]
MDPCDVEFFISNDLTNLGVIGIGSFGIIYKVYSEQYKTEFAVKRILKDRFREDEYESMITIKSSGIVTLYRYVYHGPYIYLMMELCKTSIDKLLQEKRDMSISELNEIALGMIQSVKCCHETGISHGDIKPSNFLVDSYGRIKICDFGLAKKNLADQKYTDYSGTRMFLSPEIVQLQPYDAFKADILALGVTLYYLYVHSYPWPTDSKSAFVQNLISGVYCQDNIGDSFFRKLIRKCLNINPKERPSAQDLFNQSRAYISIAKKKKIIKPFNSCGSSISLVLDRKILKPRRLSFGSAIL